MSVFQMEAEGKLQLEGQYDSGGAGRGRVVYIKP